MTQYEMFMDVAELQSFTKAAKKNGYTQSAVSQMIQSLEKTLQTTLFVRNKQGVQLTADGQMYYPYIQAISTAIRSLEQKKKEMEGLEQQTIRIGTFVSVSRHWLPRWIKEFKLLYPQVRFELIQGEYSNINQWILDGSIDFGFVNEKMVADVETYPIYEDRMVAVLPMESELAKQEMIPLEQLEKASLIVLDEGKQSVALQAFEKEGLRPHIEYKVYDDTSIIEMVKQGLGYSILYELVIQGFEDQVAIRPIFQPLKRTVALAWNQWELMPRAARTFVQYILENTRKEDVQ